MKRYPMTTDQREELDQDLARIMENLGRIADLLRACYREEDQPVFRAEEARGAVQRLMWALERQSEAATDDPRPGGILSRQRKSRQVNTVP